ncbi:hypothetical protein Moror_9435 [Moniliophthora roreri MCA 2997]|uniref:Uncharacterized protein n=1 Tax=Moniliophthora roreri (strain MCA 2997) TaxID=1381753 RepID=V2WGM4_MONRO|nr:hypothetical protein Moror_9435 [Moniliophthora roreri MCA 2997]
MTTSPSLPFEVLNGIYKSLNGKYRTLATSCLVDWQVNQAASSILYKDLVLNFGRPPGPRWMSDERALKSGFPPVPKSKQPQKMDVIPSEAAIAAPQSLRGLESVGLNTTNTTKDFFERMLSERRHPLQTIRVIFSWWDEVNFMRSVINPNLRKLTVIMEHRILPVDFVQGTERLDRIGISGLLPPLLQARNQRKFSLEILEETWFYSQDLFLLLSQIPKLADLSLISSPIYFQGQ